MSSMAPLSSSELRGEESTGKALAVSSAPVVPAPPSPSDVRACRMLGVSQQAVQDFWEHFQSARGGGSSWVPPFSNKIFSFLWQSEMGKV